MPPQPKSLSKSLILLIPALNDWDALRLLIPRIDRVAANLDWTVDVLIVDDGSTDALPPGWPNGECGAIASLSVLHLRSNLGHQRAIALGLYHAHEFTDAAAIVVMDGDGEDRAEDLRALLAEFEKKDGQEAIFAARTRRMESAAFQISYHAFRLVHWLLTGIAVRVGNFSVLPRAALTRLMVAPDIWNHYAATVYKSRFPRRLVPLARGSRLAGRSRMNFVSLLIHGLSAMSVFSERISARLLLGAVALSVASGAAGLIAGWSTAAFLLLAVAAQSLIFAAVFALAIVSRRSAPNFLLLRDAPHFLLRTTRCRTAATQDANVARLQERLLQEEGATHEEAVP